MAYHLARLTIGAFLLVGATRSWAGPGDIDANFGSGGQLHRWGTVLVLPDDRLVNIDGGRVTRVDANGKVDPTFGDGGEVVIPLPSATPGFDASIAAGTPDGGLLFAGLLRDAELTQVFETVLRLDRDGHVEKSFGGRGDGFYRLTDTPLRELDGSIPTTLSGFAVDATGRIVLAKRSFTVDGRCGGPTSIVRLTPSGTPDAAFGTNGRAAVPSVDLCGGAALFGARNDGSIVVGARGAIVGLDSSGAVDLAFGDGGHVTRELGRSFLLPDGGILIVEADSSTTASNAVFTKFDRGGRLDPTFGAGTGSVRLDFGGKFFDISDSRQSVHDFVLAPDDTHVYVKLSVLHADGTTACAGGIARVYLDGTPDLSFGRQGLTCLDYGAFWFNLLASQHNGSPLFQHQGWQTGGVYRLLADATASPGILMMVGSGYYGRRAVGEADGSVTVPVVRTAGHDGAVSLSYSTGQRHWDDDLGHGADNPATCNATPGSDFHAASGRLDWADGDEVGREISVTILDDEVEEGCERFSIGISNPQGGALTLGNDFYPDYQGSIDVAIIDDDEAATPPPISVSPDGSGSGGGGSLAWETLLALSGLLLGRRRRPRRLTGRVAGLGRFSRVRTHDSISVITRRLQPRDCKNRSSTGVPRDPGRRRTCRRNPGPPAA